MESIPIFYHNQPFGMVTVAREGARLHFSAQTPAGESGVFLRLYGLSTTPLGLLEPTGDGMTLARSFSENALKSAGLWPLPSRFLVNQPHAPIPFNGRAPFLYHTEISRCSFENGHWSLCP